MASAPASPNSPAASQVRPSAEVVEYGEFIEQQIRKTRSQVKWVEVASGLSTLAAGALVYVLAVALVDHWVFRAGLGPMGRFLALGGLLAGGLAYALRVVLPRCLRPVNPVYAAHAIEQSRPSLKNSLVNFLLLRSTRSTLLPVVYEAVEQRAATDLTDVNVEAAVDKSHLLKVLCVLAGIVLAGGAYKLFSPKDPLKSMRRMAFPWADIAAPTRVTIENLKPGDVEVFRGDSLEVSAEIGGLRNDEPVTMFYSTADGQAVDQPIALTRPEGGYPNARTGSLPGSSAGIQQDLDYFLTAGDATSKRFHVHVLPPPTILVQRLQLDYPAYTKLDPLVQERGDVKALEGTQVTITAQANQPIKTAFLDFDCDGTRDERCSVDGQRATVRFTLRLKKDGRTAEHSGYQLLFTNQKGTENPQPVRHTIEVVADLPPEVKLVAPKEQEVELASNGVLAISVHAADPDYALSRVSLVAQRGREKLLDEPLLAEVRSGEFEGGHLFEAARLRLKPGDEIEYWAEAADNKTPEANRAQSAKHRIKIVAALPENERKQQQEQQENQQQPKKNDGEGRKQEHSGRPPRDNSNQKPADKNQNEHEKNEQEKQENQKPEKGQEGNQQDRRPEKPEKGEQNGGNRSDNDRAQDQGGQTGEKQTGRPKQSEKVDGDSDPGDAIQKIAEHRQKEEQKKQKDQQGEQSQNNQPQHNENHQPQDNSQQNNPQQDKQQGGDQQQGGNQQQPDKQQGDQQQPEGGESGEEKQGPQAGGNQQQPKDQQSPQGGEQTPGGEGNQPGKAPKGQGKQRDQSGGNQQAGDESGEPGSNAPQTGEKQGGDAGGDKQESQTAESGGEEKQPDGGADQGARKEGAERQGANKQAHGKKQSGAGDQQTGEKQAAENAADRQQNAEKQAGEPDGPKGSHEKETQGENAQEKPDGTKERQPGDEQPNANDNSEQPHPGEGDKAAGSNKSNDKQPKKDEQPGEKEKGGDPQSEKGEPGAGEKGANEHSSPEPQKTQKQRNKKQQSPGNSDKKTEDKNSPQSPAIGDHESDSQGNDSGDRAGGGKKGGGQSGNQQGTGGPGKNTESDEGGSAAQTPGEGETSQQAGDKIQANRPTGKSGDQSGAGSTSRPGGSQSGPSQAPNKQGPQQANPQSPQPSGPKPGQPNSAGRPNGQQPPPAGGAPGSEQSGKGKQGPGAPAGGQPSDGDVPKRTAPEPGGSDANLEYSKKVTDLALDHLKDQLAKDQPDQDLLDQLGWTRDDMERFVRRWEEMKRRAQEQGPAGEAARKQLDETLKSLGLRPQGTSLEGDKLQKDEARRMRESRRSEPPAEYAEQYEAYTKSRAKGR